MRHALLCLLLACGSDDPDPIDGSGVDATIALGTLSPAEIDDVCAYGVSLSREVICNGNPTQSVTSAEACQGLLSTISEGCVATVGDMEACFEDLAAETDEQVCALSNPASCEFLGDPSCIDI